MIIVDLYETIKKTGVFATWMGIADTHILVDTEDEQAYQPLDKRAYEYLKFCNEEIKAHPEMFGKIYTFTDGDLTELFRSTIRKTKAAYHKNDSRAEDSMHKRVLNDYVLPKLQVLTRGTKFIGGVAGNHLIEFSQESRGTGYCNSEEYLIGRLGGKYCGEGMMLVNYHIGLGSQRVLKKILIMHGAKGGNKAAIIRQLQRLHEMGVRVDCIVVAHAHDPLTGFYSRYDYPDTAEAAIKKHDTLVVCLGSTRDGIKKGYDDYCERFMFTPSAGRYPVLVFRATKRNNASHGSMDVVIRPYIM